jgi:DNA polymerase I-like protein with 3'-5' exonuclease and polymerase domains
MIAAHANSAIVTISGQEFPYSRRWSGRRLLPADGYLAFDTETEVVDLKRQIPRLAMAAASAGERESCLIHPDDIGKFILAHKAMHFICHHAAFDFWVVERHLRQRGEEKALQAWWAIANSNRLHDSMLLDMLVRLTRDDSYPVPRDLATIAKHYADLTISKDNPYRTRYGEIINKDWDDVEEDFYAYAIKDAIVTKPTYAAIRKQALTLVDAFGRSQAEILPDARQKFGLLTEAVQVKKAIALTDITRNGIGVDMEWVRRTEDELREELMRSALDAQQICKVYKTDDEGQLILSGKTRTPAFVDQDMRAELQRIKETIEEETGSKLKIPNTKKGISRSVKVWSDYAHLHPFLSHWIKAQGAAKLLLFFTLFEDHVDLHALAGVLQVDPEQLAGALKVKAGDEGEMRVKVADLPGMATTKNRKLRKLNLEPERVLSAARTLADGNRQPFCTVHPSYCVMVRTGRTSCSSPNIQQIPRDGAFRQAFVPSLGSFLLTVDYKFIELVTFAATAKQRYGKSRLSEVIQEGIDPHEYTAAMMLDLSHPEFLAWKDNEKVVGNKIEKGKEVPIHLKDRYEENRQKVKPVNFGTIGGLGANSLVAYARSTYKVELTLEEATAKRQKLIHEIYPEMGVYLSEDGAAIVARNLQAPLEEVRNELGDTHLSSVRKILAGDPKRVDGKPYQSTFVSRTWASLRGLNRNPELKEALEKRQPSEALASRVCHAGVATLSGRIRGHVRYTQARNTPFQGLAADGAALAMFELVKEGFRIIGFVHDEILLELPDEGGYVSEAKVRRIVEIMCRAMDGVLVGGIPVGCEAALSKRWNKKAKLVATDGKVYPWEPKKA